ncbi:MAG: polyphosphate polymerase domain-containing protein [Vicinamibacterales bacterium]|nr:polyphosphate polymerase domain-containing protein [Vicinamibacterales bacterium]
MSPSGVLALFSAASPALLESRALLTRVDRKFMLNESRLADVLTELTGAYARVPTTLPDGARYDTTYFDTPDRQFFHDHRRGRLPRCKVRMRTDHGRGVAFLEVKCKGANERTRKSRAPWRHAQEAGPEALDGEDAAFLAAHCRTDSRSLHTALRATFTRTTLVGLDTQERITIDRSIRFTMEGRTDTLDPLVIVEVKQPRLLNTTCGIRALRQARVHETGVSKYILGTARLAPVRMSPFKPVFRLVEHLLA